jgi:hypothetical protein
METPIRKIAATMSMAVRDGYKIFEKVWEQREGQIWLKKLAYRSGLTTHFLYDGHGNIDGAEQETTVNGEQKKIPYPKDKIAYYLYNSEENPYSGESDFMPVFYHYDKKHKLYAIAHLAYQLNAVPIRLGMHPSSLKGDELQKFREALASLGTTVTMTFPNTCEVTTLESDRRLTEFLYLIRHHDGMMSRAFLTQFMNLGQEGAGGSFALSSDQSNLFLMAIMGLLEDIAEVFNKQVIPQLIDWNFGTKKYPTIVFNPFSDSIRSSVVHAFDSLLAARFPSISPEFALELEKAMAGEIGLAIDYDAVKLRQEEERKKMLEAERIAAATPDVEPGAGKTAGDAGSKGRPPASKTAVQKVKAEGAKLSDGDGNPLDPSEDDPVEEEDEPKKNKKRRK